MASRLLLGVSDVSRCALPMSAMPPKNDQADTLTTEQRRIHGLR